MLAFTQPCERALHSKGEYDGGVSISSGTCDLGRFEGLYVFRQFDIIPGGSRD